MKYDWKWRGPLYRGSVRTGVVAAQPAVPVEVRRGRWLNLYSLLDGRGHDACCGIMAELHRDAPDGPVLRRRMLVDGGDAYEPFGDGVAYFRCVGQPKLFGSRKTGVFVVSYYVYAHQFVDGVLYNSGSPRWPGRPGTQADTLRIHALQLEYLPEEDDWKVTVPPAMLRQQGYEEGEAFCSLGPGYSMNHSLQPPVQLDADGAEFAELAGLTRRDTPGRIGGHGGLAPIRWRFSSRERRYRWVETGAPWPVDEGCGEAGAVALPDGAFLASIRQFGSGAIILARTDDLFHAPRQLARHPGTSAPRTIWRCLDGQVRMFTSFKHLSPFGHARNPLCELAVSPATLALGEPRVIADAGRQRLPWRIPFLDMAKYVEVAGRRAMLLFRAIDRRQTVGNDGGPPLAPDAMEHQGVYYLEAEIAP